MSTKPDRRKTRVDMVAAQLQELDDAREIVLSQLRDDKVFPKDLPNVVEGLIKTHRAERELYDEAFLTDETEGEFEPGDLIEEDTDET